MIKLFVFIFLLSCTNFVKNTDGQYYTQAGDTSVFQILFSHNINGETHPCGCRKFPLGGLSQANGIIRSESKNHPTLYIDTGDTFFESTKVPPFIRKSTEFKAIKIAEALDQLGLKFMIPGDQDFALGEDFLIRIKNQVKFDFLISNAHPKLRLPHKKLIHIKTNDQNFFFIGVLNPALLKGNDQFLFTNMQRAIQTQLDLIDKKGLSKDKYRIILLSHNGLSNDEKLAEKFPQIDWIIGSHTQSFLRHPQYYGKTKVVQVLSRNHYIGKLKLPNNKKAKPVYEIIQTRDETEKLISPNPMISWLQNYKTEFDQILAKEQNDSLGIAPDKDQMIPTYISCSDCHKEQVGFWQETSHSIAYTTLIKEKAIITSLVFVVIALVSIKARVSGNKNMILAHEGALDTKQYWKDFNKTFKLKKSVREMSPGARKSMAKEWLKFDTKKNVMANFGNVQCLNCHTQNSEHPFGEPVPMKLSEYERKCLSCHTADQSLSGTIKMPKDLPVPSIKSIFRKKLKEVSYPKIER